MNIAPVGSFMPRQVGFKSNEKENNNPGENFFSQFHTNVINMANKSYGYSPVDSQKIADYIAMKIDPKEKRQAMEIWNDYKIVLGFTSTIKGLPIAVKKIKMQNFAQNLAENTEFEFIGNKEAQQKRQELAKTFAKQCANYGPGYNALDDIILVKSFYDERKIAQNAEPCRPLMDATNTANMVLTESGKAFNERALVLEAAKSL